MKKTSLEKKILSSYFLIFFIMVVLIIYFTASIYFIVSQAGSSYKTNSILENYQNELEKTNESLNNYLKFHSYETINAYFNQKNTIENIMGFLSEHPDKDKIRQKEYIIRQLSKSWLFYADNTVKYKRANNSKKSEININLASKVYSFLETEIRSLDSLYFQNNRQRYESAVSHLKKTACLGFSIFVLISGVTFVLAFIFLRTSLKPLTKISEAALQISSNNYEIEPMEHSDVIEMENISKAFNVMTKSIREYVDTIWEKAIEYNRLQQKEIEMTSLYNAAKFKALQSQINPHFLFNTLNTGAQLAMLEGSDKTCQFLEKIADFYRYNLQMGEVSNLEDELTSVDNYIYIMKMRFGQKFIFEKDISYSNSALEIPGMVLQPLVEDCIKHGFASVVKGGIIKLKVYSVIKSEGSTLFIEVSDNGCGFPEDVKKRVLNLSGGTEDETSIKEDGIGLENVISRLRIFFKDEKVFDIEENEGGGTKFVIRIRNV